MGSWDEVEQRKAQAKIDANSRFIRVAKKMSQIAYGKVTIKPDPSNPLKVSIGTYNTAWYPITFKVGVREIRKRKYDYQDHYSRYQFEPRAIAGLYRDSRDGADSRQGYYKVSLGKLTSRSPKLFLNTLKELETKIDNEIKQENQVHNDQIIKESKLAESVKKVKGLNADATYLGPIRIVNNGNYYHSGITINPDSASLSSMDVTIDQLNEISKIMGWREESTNA